jgi:hypothetical protein
MPYLKLVVFLSPLCFEHSYFITSQPKPYRTLAEVMPDDEEYVFDVENLMDSSDGMLYSLPFIQNVH